MFSPTKQGACYKIIILGNSSVGKTSILMRYIDGTFSQHRATIGTDIFVKSICINEKTIKLQIWDTSGQEKYRTVMTAYYRGADACVMVFDLGDPTSFQELEYWMDQIIRSIAPPDPENFPFILLGNKVDLIPRAVSEEKARRWSGRRRIPYVEVSAKDDLNIDYAFKLLGTILTEKETADDFDVQMDSPTVDITLPQPVVKPNRNDCC